MNTDPTYRPVDQTYPTTHLPHAERPAPSEGADFSPGTLELLPLVNRARLTAAGGVHPVQIAGTIAGLCQRKGLVLGDPPYDEDGDIRLVLPGDDGPPIYWVNPITGEVI